MKRVLLIPYAFLLMNWAAVAGLYYFARGSPDLWKNIWAKPFSSHLSSRERFLGGS